MTSDSAYWAPGEVRNHFSSVISNENLGMFRHISVKFSLSSNLWEGVSFKKWRQEDMKLKKNLKAMMAGSFWWGKKKKKKNDFKGFLLKRINYVSKNVISVEKFSFCFSSLEKMTLPNMSLTNLMAEIVVCFLLYFVFIPNQDFI